LVNRGMMGVNSLPKAVTRQRRGCDLNPGSSVPESSTLTTLLPSRPGTCYCINSVYCCCVTEVVNVFYAPEKNPQNSSKKLLRLDAVL